MRIKFSLALVLGSIVASTVLSAQSTPAGALLALSKKDHTLAIVDPATLQVIAKVPIGDDPHEVIASSDGKTAYVSNYGFGAFNTLAVVDLVGQKALPAIDLGPLRGPHGLDFVGGKLWFTAEAAKAIGSYDPATHESRLDPGHRSEPNAHDLCLSGYEVDRHHQCQLRDSQHHREDGSQAGPADGRSAARRRWPTARSTTQVRPAATGMRRSCPVGNGSEGFDVSPDGREIWVANSQDGTVSIIDAAKKQVTQTLEVNAKGANRLKFTLDGKLALISTLRGPDLLILDTATRKVIKRLPIGHGAAGILMQPDGSRAFVACSPDDYVTVIDLKSLEVAGHIDVGGNPDGLAWASRQ